MACTCGGPVEIRRSAVGRPWRRFLSPYPLEDLGTDHRVACRALGWTEQRTPPVAHGLALLLPDTGELVRADVHDSEAFLSAAARVIAAEQRKSVVVAKAVSMIGERVLFQGIEIVEPVPLEKLYAMADQAAEELLGSVFKVEPIATLNPAHPGSRSILIRRLADAMVAKVGPWERRASTAGNRTLSADWPNLSAAQRRALIADAALEIKNVPVRAVRGISDQISVDSTGVFRGARSNAIERFKLNIGANLTLPDQRAINAMQRTSVSWITNEYGVRANSFESQAKQIVESGMERGLGRVELSHKLRQQFGSSLSGRTESYFMVYAGAVVDRSRTRSELNSYKEAQITKWIASAVMDEVTTDFCRWIDGKVFDVDTSNAIFDDAEKPGMSPEEMRAANPWVRTQTSQDGKVTWQAGGKPIMSVTRSGMGSQSAGTYKPLAGAGKLDSLGVGGPPFHGNCRTTSVPDVSTVVVGKPPPPPPPKPRVKQPPPKPKPSEAIPPPVAAPGKPGKTPLGGGRDLSDRHLKEMVEYDEDILKAAIIQADKDLKKSGRIKAGTQKTIRRQFRAAIEREGMVSHDVQKRRGSRNVLSVEPKPPNENWAAYHTWDGRVAVMQSYWDDLVGWAKGTGSSYQRERYVAAFQMMLHEEIHGASPKGSNVYFAFGKKLEEATTELAAKGVKKGIESVSKVRPSWAGYGDLTKAVVDAVDDVLVKQMPKAQPFSAARQAQRRMAQDIAERASINMRRTTKKFNSPDTYLKTFTEQADDLWPDEIFAGLSAKEKEILLRSMRRDMKKRVSARLNKARIR